MAANARQTYDAVTTLTKTLEGLIPKLVSPGAPAPAAAPAGKPETLPAQPADAGYATLSAQVTALQRDIAVKSAIADHGFTGELRTTFEDLVSGSSADQVKSIAEKLSKLKPAAAAPPNAAAPTVRPGTSNAGPAAPGAAPLIPDRLRDIPPEVLRGMSMQEIRDKYEAQKRAQGQGNPWAAAREQLTKK